MKFIQKSVYKYELFNKTAKNLPKIKVEKPSNKIVWGVIIFFDKELLLTTKKQINKLKISKEIEK